MDIILEKGQKIIQLLLLRPSVETHPTCIQQNANQPHTEKIIRHIQRNLLLG